MPLGVEVGLGPGHIVLDEDLAPLQKGGHSPQFSAHICGAQTAAVDQDATWYGGRPRPSRHYVHN